MMKRIVSACVLLSILASAPQALALWGKSESKVEDGDADMGLGEYKGLKHAVGVKDFENQAGWRGRWELGQNLSAMLESALYDSGRFVLVEREKLRDVLAEQDLAASGRTAKAKDVAKTGFVRPAKYIATGDLTEVETAQSGGDGGIRIKGFKIGLGKKDAQITIIAKLIDTTTGEIVAKKRIVGKPSGTKFDFGYAGADFGADFGGFKKTPLGQAAQEAIVAAAKFFATTMEEFPFEGNVVTVADNGMVIINRGGEFGVETGQVLVMQEEGETLVDPSTGAVLGKSAGSVIGKLKVENVQEKFSYCSVLEGESNPDVGTIIRAQ